MLEMAHLRVGRFGINVPVKWLDLFRVKKLIYEMLPKAH